MTSLAFISLVCYNTPMKQFRDTLYFVTEDGKVYSRYLVGGDNRYKKGTPSKNNFREVGAKSGPYLVVRRRDGFCKGIHEMVMECYGPPKPTEPGDWVVNHNDENPHNNHIDNLSWLTRGGNVSYSASLHNNRRLLTPEQEDELRASYVPRVVTRQMLAERYGIGLGTVKDILRR